MARKLERQKPAESRRFLAIGMPRKRAAAA